MKHLKIRKGSRLHGLVSVGRELAYLRTWRTDMIYRSGYRARSIFLEIASRRGLRDRDIYYLTADEARSLIRQPLSARLAREIKRRKDFYVKAVSGGKFTVFAGKDWKKKTSFLRQAHQRSGQVSGKPAFYGRAQGRVAILRSEKDIEKVKKGDVLVAVMTFPHFISAMEKASAFVTDEGGITCHAAIVSREMKKPCVTATKIATKVFKDGDLVEVDANGGIIKLLNQGLTRRTA
jgi:phosphoenolpyruvate synthase/pyruvate phosphate dikinase